MMQLSVLNITVIILTDAHHDMIIVLNKNVYITAFRCNPVILSAIVFGPSGVKVK